MTVFPVCPFCGVAADQPHDSQTACIEALQAEIDKTREMLAAVDAARSDLPPAARERRDVQTT
jgi:hypothetical protein